MCGIAGKISGRAGIPPGLLERMCAAMVHRGPDSRGISRAPGAEIGIQRLAVIDLETGDQPVFDEAGSIAVVLNGEIYNYRELRRDLEVRGHRFSTKGDTEVIAHLYEESGPACVDALNGMFALAVWDSGRERLLLARDRVGKKPLYYCHRDGAISFASELAALVEDQDVPREIDPDALDSYLAYGYVPAPLSIWRHVVKLPPASTLVYDRGADAVAISRYWALDYSRKLNAEPHELQEELRRSIAAAVRRRMIADVPLGAFLSGGVDSSIVVSEMAAASTRPVKTFSIGFEIEEYNELPRARRIAREFATDHHEAVIRPDALELIPRIVRHYGEPYADSSAIPSFYLSEFARRQVTVALNGDGGDESFAGYRRYIANQVTAHLERLPGPLRRVLGSAGRALPLTSRAMAPTAYARRLLDSVGIAAPERYRDYVSIFDRDTRSSLLDPGFAAQVDPVIADDAIERPWQAASGSDRLDIALEVDVNTYLPGDLLAKMDIATMAYSLEARSPLLDPEVMEFAASLPANQKLHRLQKKWILRRAYANRLPHEILSGAKRGFVIPLGGWFRGPLRSFVRETLLDPGALGRGYFREAAIRDLLDDHDQGRGDRSLQIWSLLMLEHWHREFMVGAVRHGKVIA